MALTLVSAGYGSITIRLGPSRVGDCTVVPRIALVEWKGKETLQQWGAPLVTSATPFIASMFAIAFIGQWGPQQPVNWPARLQGPEASNGLSPMKRTTTLATTLAKRLMFDVP